MENYIIPDSPNWLFTNSSNIASGNSSVFIYSAHKKTIISSTLTGKVQDVIVPGSDLYVTHVALSENLFTIYCSDKSLRTYSLHPVQEVQKIKVDECLGLKYWGNDIVCITKSHGQVYRSGILVQEIALNGFSAISVSEEYLAIGQNTSAVIYNFLQEFSIEGNWLALDVKKYEDVYVVLIDRKSVKAYKKDKVICEVPLKRYQCKLKQPVFAVCWVGPGRFIYSTISGELIIVNIEPLVTQSFMNNPHSKALISLQCVDQGVISIGMDRILSLWSITSISIDEKCPRTYVSAFVYTEPIWEYQSLEGSVRALAVVHEKIFASCGKNNLLVFDIQSENMHGRSIGKNISGNVIFIEPDRTAEHLALATSTEVLVFHVAEEKIIYKVLLTCIYLQWDFTVGVLIGTSHKISHWDYSESTTKSLYESPLEIKVFLNTPNGLYIGTNEGNVLLYSNGGYKAISVVHNKAITCLALGTFLAAGSEDGCISIHSIPIVILEKHCRPVLNITWIGNILASASLDHTVQLWDSATGTPLSNYRAHSGAVRFCLTNTLKKSILITGSDDQTIRIWSILEKFPAIAPPKIPGCKKQELVKSLFSNLHIFLYQQTKENAFLSILALLGEEKTLEKLVFSMGHEEALEVIGMQEAVEFKLWLAILNGNVKKSIEVEWKLNADLEEFSYLIGGERYKEYAMKKAEEALLVRKIHKCIVWYLTAGNVEKAVKLYIDQKMHIEAIAVAGVFGYPTEDIYREWAFRFISTAKLEQAVKCFIAIGDYKSALETIGKIPSSEKQIQIEELIHKKMQEINPIR